MFGRASLRATNSCSSTRLPLVPSLSCVSRAPRRVTPTSGHHYQLCLFLSLLHPVLHGTVTSRQRLSSSSLRAMNLRGVSYCSVTCVTSVTTRQCLRSVPPSHQLCSSTRPPLCSLSRVTGPASSHTSTGRHRQLCLLVPLSVTPSRVKSKGGSHRSTFHVQPYSLAMKVKQSTGTHRFVCFLLDSRPGPKADAEGRANDRLRHPQVVNVSPKRRFQLDLSSSSLSSTRQRVI